MQSMNMSGAADEALPNRTGALGQQLLDRIVDNTISPEVEMLGRLKASIRMDALARSLEVLNAADRIFVQGIGTSGAMASYLAVRLLRRGRQVISTDFTGVRLADVLVTMRKGDALLLTNRVGNHRDIEVAARHATACGVPTVVLTELVEGELTRGGATVLIDILVSALTAMDRPRAEVALPIINALRVELTGRTMDLSGALPELDRAVSARA